MTRPVDHLPKPRLPWGDQFVDEAFAALAPSGIHGKIDQYLRDLWLDMRNNASVPHYAYAAGAVDALQACEALTAEQAELWTRRFTTCPGHDDEGGRVWCAYCGDMSGKDSGEYDGG